MKVITARLGRSAGMGLLLVAVAAFNIVATLVMVVMERRKEIAILRAMGARAGSVAAIFLCEGAALGLTGTAIEGRTMLAGADGEPLTCASPLAAGVLALAGYAPEVERAAVSTWV